MNRMERLIAIITLLQSRKYVSTGQMSQKFGISVRTVYRDLRALAESGIPIGFEAAKGYSIVQGYFLPPVSFTTEEANALVLMESLAKGFADKSIQKNYSAALGKLRAGLRSVQKDMAEAMSQNIKLQVPANIYQNSEYLSQLQSAISAKTIVEIRFKNQNEEASRRDVEPIGLIFYAFSWHLIGWCHERAGYRDFKVTRIQDILLTSKAFKIEKHITLDDYMPKLPVNY